MAAVVDWALTALLDELARRKFAAKASPDEPEGRTLDATASPDELAAAGPVPHPERQSSGRHIPARVKRTVWKRDGGRCAFVAKGGRRCEARGFLEYHHVRPYAVGGEPTVDNIEIRCRAHNAYEADLFFAASRKGLEFVSTSEVADRVGSVDSFRNELANPRPLTTV
jgi:hypothetical protein